MFKPEFFWRHLQVAVVVQGENVNVAVFTGGHKVLRVAGKFNVENPVLAGVAYRGLLPIYSDENFS